MTTKVRTYSVGTNPDNGRETLTLHCNQLSTTLPFNVWRDLGMLAGKSYDNLAGHIVYEFLVPGRMPDAEKILQGAMWEKRP